jgi:hypothetical protein
MAHKGAMLFSFPVIQKVGSFNALDHQEKWAALRLIVF